MSQADDLLDPFPYRDALREKLEAAHKASAPARRDKHLREILTRVVQGRQTFDDVQTLAVELGIPMTIRSTHSQD